MQYSSSKTWVVSATFDKYICYPPVTHSRERFISAHGYNLTISRFVQAIELWMLCSFSDTGDFVIAFTLHYDTNNVQINSGDIIDLSTALYGKLEITNSAGISQGLDIHLRSVTADNDNLDGGQEFDLITDG